MDYFDTIIVIFSCTSGFVICPFLIYAYELDYTNPNSNEEFIMMVVLPFLILLGVYMSYRKITELRLKKIRTEFDSSLNQKLILEFAKQNDFSIRRKTNYIVLDKTSLMNPLIGKTTILFTDDRSIYFTMILDGPKVNFPTIISHFIFERHMKKWFSQNLALKDEL